MDLIDGGDVVENWHLSLPGDQSLSFAREDTGAHGRIWTVNPPIIEPHGQSPWYLHEIPSYAKASEGYPPVAKSTRASIFRPLNVKPSAIGDILYSSCQEAKKNFQNPLNSATSKKGLFEGTLVLESYKVMLRGQA